MREQIKEDHDNENMTRASLRSQELISRPLVVASLPISRPFLWNKLPIEIRNSQSISIAILKSKLKIFLFKLAYNLF